MLKNYAVYTNNYIDSYSLSFPFNATPIEVMKHHRYLLTANRTIEISLFILFVMVPLTVNPFNHDAWYKPKIDAICVLIVIITLAVAVRHFLFKVPFRYKPIPILIPLLACAASAILSTLFSTAPHLSIFGDYMREEGLSTLLAYGVLTFLFSQLIESERQLHALLKGLIATSVLISLIGIANYCGYSPVGHSVAYSTYLGPGVGSTLGNPNFLGKYLVLVLPLSVAFYFSSQKTGQALWFALAFLICLLALVLTFTRASWLSFLVGLVIFVLLAGRDLKRTGGKQVVVPLLVIFTVSSALLWVPVPNRKESFIDLARKKVNASFDLGKGRGVATRLFVWKKAMGIIQKRPFFGFGPDAHLEAMRGINLEYSLKFNNWSVGKRGEQRIIRFSGLTLLDRAHNNYLDLAISQGLVGLAAYLTTVITFLIWLLGVMLREQNRSRRMVRCGIFASFCGYLFNDVFIFSVVSVSPTFWSLMGMALTLNSTEKCTPGVAVNRSAEKVTGTPPTPAEGLE